MRARLGDGDGVETAHVERRQEEEEEEEPSLAAVDSALVMMQASSESSEILSPYKSFSKKKERESGDFSTSTAARYM